MKNNSSFNHVSVIKPPDEAIVSINTASGTDGLGECFDGRYLSIILN